MNFRKSNKVKKTINNSPMIKINTFKSKNNIMNKKFKIFKRILTIRINKCNNLNLSKSKILKRNNIFKN